MRARLIGFGEIEIEGQRYRHDVVIERGTVRKRAKRLSKPFRGEFGHTPLSAAERIPWVGERLIVGTGWDGDLPVMAEVYEEARRRGVEIMAVPTREACRLLRDADADDVGAVLHVTC